MDVTETAPLQLKDLDQIQGLCMRLTAAVVDGKPGIDEEDIHWLENTEHDYKLVIARLRNAKHFSKSKDNQIKEKGLQNISLTEAEVGVELGEALLCTSRMINETNPAAVRDGRSQGDRYIDACTEASRKFTEFFIKAHKRHGLGGEELMRLFDTIFVRVNLNAELKAKALDRFPGGVAAAIRSYLEIQKELPDWDIEVSSHEEDKHCGVDLVATSPDRTEKRYYGIKGNKNFPATTITEVTETDQMESIRKRLALSPLDVRETTSQEAALYNIYEYTRKENSKGQKTRAYWVEASSAF